MFSAPVPVRVPPLMPLAPVVVMAVETGTVTVAPVICTLPMKEAGPIVWLPVFKRTSPSAAALPKVPVDVAAPEPPPKVRNDPAPVVTSTVPSLSIGGFTNELPTPADLRIVPVDCTCTRPTAPVLKIPKSPVMSTRPATSSVRPTPSAGLPASDSAPLLATVVRPVSHDPPLHVYVAAAGTLSPPSPVSVPPLMPFAPLAVIVADGGTVTVAPVSCTSPANEAGPIVWLPVLSRTSP